MTISADELYEFAQSKGVGLRAKNALIFIEENRLQVADFFKEASASGLITSPGIRYAANGCARNIDYQLYSSMDEWEYEGATHELDRQVKNWAIPENLNTGMFIRHNRKFQTSIQPSPYLHIDSPGHAKYMDKLGEYNIECIKALNCLTQFYFGERFAPNIKPVMEYKGKKFADLVEQAHSHSRIDEMHAQLWEQGFLQCDIDR